MKQLLCGIVLAAVTLVLASPQAWGQVSIKTSPAKGKWVVEPFDYKGVTLDGGTFKSQVDEVRKYYLAIPNDDLLKGFRKRAGFEASGKDMGGWYSGDVFHIFGQIISGMSRMYAGTGDQACREKVNTLLAEWGKCIAKDGYFFYSAKPNAPHYIYEKTVCGLVDAYVYCDNKDALKYLSQITDWAIKNLHRNRGLGDNGTEWYTLSENLYRAYLATGDTKYRDFAEVWEYTDYWNMYAKKAPIPENLHAYSHVNTLSGAGAAYWVKGDKRYLDLLSNAYDYLQNEATFVTGGFGPNEQLLAREKMIQSLQTTHNTFETQCGSWAGFKMSKYLIGFTGDARYGDWIELLTLNGIGASPVTGPGGAVMYYSDYNMQGGTKFFSDGWTCCAGTRQQAVADYHDLIYFKDADCLYVNLFAPSTVKWNREGAVVTVKQSTRFPEEDKTELAVRLEKAAEFTVAIRVPGWLAKPMTAKVNGKDIPAQADKQHWARFRRTWQDGDKLEITLPMDFRVSRLSKTQPLPAALQYGPVTLAFDNAPTVRKLDLANLAKGLKPDPAKPLTWTLTADASTQLLPYYSIAKGEEYFVYLWPGSGNRISRRGIKFTPQWNGGGRHSYTNAVGATAEAEFEGVGIRWVGFLYDDAGKAEVTIDGKVVAVVDQYGPKRDAPFEWTHKGLAPGKHTIRLRLLEEKTKQSRDRFINIAGLEILTEEKTPTSATSSPG